jgi:hypothetical protein
MSQEVIFTFMTAGPRFHFALAGGFDPVGDYSSPLLTGMGFRSFDYLPPSQEPGITEEHTVVRTLMDRDGRAVELSARIGSPPQWYLRWQLSNGALYTHLREEDGPDSADFTVNSLGIVEGDDGVPFLLPEPPLKRGVSARPGLQEIAAFRSPTGWSIQLKRPGFINAGQVVQAPGSENVVLRGGTSDGLEVVVFSGTDLKSGQDLMSQTQDSLAQA